MNEYRKPLPEPTPISAPFWEGVRQHQLLVQKCEGCGKLRHTPKPLCPSCLSSESTWLPMSGEGFVYTFTVIHRVVGPGFEEDVPYVVALVELNEGVRLISNIVGSSPERVWVGMPVKAVYEDVDEQTSLFKFVAT